MPITTVSELADFPIDAPIMEIRGKLTKLFPKKETPKGHLQNGEFTDSTGTQKITFADAACIDNDKEGRNKEVIIKCTKSTGGHGWTGLKLKDGGQYGISLWVTGTASIEFVGQPTGNTSRRPSETRPTLTQQHQGPHDQWGMADRIVDCYANIRTLVNEKIEGATSADVATVFIEYARAGGVAQWVIGATRQVKIPSAPEDPSLWAQAVVPAGTMKGKSLEELAKEDIKKLFDYYDSQNSNSKFAECVYRAAEVLGVLPKSTPPPAKQQDPDLDPEDQIPF